MTKTIVGNKREIKRIALAYNNAKDELDTITESERIRLRSIVNKMFSDMSRQTHIDFTKKNPYRYDVIDPMRFDYEHARMIKVNVSGNNSKLWGPVYNLMFRAVHDVIHAMFKYDFNYHSEVWAFEKQLWLTIESKAIRPPNPILFLYEKVLRSEIIYQAAYKEYFGEFHVPVQKIILQDL
jgi:hypothetical protein